MGWTKNNYILHHLSLKTSKVLIRGIEAIYKVGGTQYNRYQFKLFFRKENWLVILFIQTKLSQYNDLGLSLKNLGDKRRKLVIKKLYGCNTPGSQYLLLPNISVSETHLTFCSTIKLLRCSGQSFKAGRIWVLRYDPEVLQVLCFESHTHTFHWSWHTVTGPKRLWVGSKSVCECVFV